MKTNYKFIGALFVCLYIGPAVSLNATDEVAALKNKLQELSNTSSNTYFIKHCDDFISVIKAKGVLTASDSSFLGQAYDKFNETSMDGNPSSILSYLNRQRQFVVSWVSPTDGAVSFVKLGLPEDWDPESEYPLYIELHGLWNVAANPIDFMTYSFRGSPSSSFQYEDGYSIAPWGRGNMWYKGISETDIWEGIAEIEKRFKIDPSRVYLNGHSMGGFGAWYIASRSIHKWAALGIHAGALWYDQNVLSSTVFETFKDLPVYFVCGLSDGLLDVNQSAYQSLVNVGNKNVEFVTFEGGHDYFSENVENMYLWMKDFVNEDWYLKIENNLFASKIENIRCFPNPVKNTGHIEYTVGESKETELILMDVYGRRVKLLEKGFKAAGTYEIKLDAYNLKTGLYLCLLRVGNEISSINISVVK